MVDRNGWKEVARRIRFEDDQIDTGGNSYDIHFRFLIRFPRILRENRIRTPIYTNKNSIKHSERALQFLAWVYACLWETEVLTSFQSLQ